MHLNFNLSSKLKTLLSIYANRNGVQFGLEHFRRRRWRPTTWKKNHLKRESLQNDRVEKSGRALMFRSVNFVFVFRLVFSSSLSLSLSLSCERTNERTNEPSVMTIAWCFWAFTLRNIRSNSSCFSQLIIHLVNANEKAKIILFLSLIYANAILNWICMRTLLRHRQSISVDKSESVICTNWCLASFVTRHRLNARNVFVHAKSKLTHWHFWLNRERSVKRNATFRTTRSLMKMIHFIAGKNK